MLELRLINEGLCSVGRAAVQPEQVSQADKISYKKIIMSNSFFHAIILLMFPPEMHVKTQCCVLIHKHHNVPEFTFPTSHSAHHGNTVKVQKRSPVKDLNAQRYLTPAGRITAGTVISLCFVFSLRCLEESDQNRVYRLRMERRSQHSIRVCVLYVLSTGKCCINDSPGVDILFSKEINNGIYHSSCLQC